MSLNPKIYYEAEVDKATSIERLNILAYDLIQIAGADYDIWIKKVNKCSTKTQLQIVCEDLLALI